MIAELGADLVAELGADLECNWSRDSEFDRLKRRVATITWDWIPILDGVGYPFWLRAAFS